MTGATLNAGRQGGIGVLTPRERIAALADAGSAVSLDAARPSPHLARFGIAASDDDGVATATAFIGGARVLVAAQDERFLRGSVGANHAGALHDLFTRALTERPAAVVLLLASGGVRLHEANAAELALARALRALFAVRAAGIAVVAIGVGDVFGGASILACAGERLALLAEARIGLSGPKVIEAARGPTELTAADTVTIDAVFGARARASAGDADLVADDASALRGWIGAAVRDAVPFAAHVLRTQAELATRVAPRAAPAARPPLLQDLREVVATDASAWLWRAGWALIARPFAGETFDGAAVHALDEALLAATADDGARVLVVTEDSHGHEVSRAAEVRFDSRFLAHHAAVLACLRERGVREFGLLCGSGHSAAFFVNGLQAPRLLALPGARVIAMEPAAIARVTGRNVAALLEDDPLLGQPVRHLAALGGVDGIAVDALETLLRQ